MRILRFDSGMCAVFRILLSASFDTRVAVIARLCGEIPNPDVGLAFWAANGPEARSTKSIPTEPKTVGPVPSYRPDRAGGFLSVNDWPAGSRTALMHQALPIDAGQLLYPVSVL